MTLTNASIVLFVLALPILVELMGRKPLGHLYRYFLGISVLLLMALDWAALHDIVRGRQPHYRWEYTVLAMSLAVLVYLIFSRRRRANPS